jgi:hypothetical protein
MLVGPGIQGGRVVGGFDDAYYGLEIDPATAEPVEGSQILSSEAVGATLLAMADIDPAAHITGVDPLTGVLS